MTDEEITKALAETWYPLHDFPGYEVSNLGRVRSFRHKNGRRKSPIILKQNNTGRYFIVQLWIDGICHTKQVSGLVLTAFKGNCPHGMEACHNDGNGFNNNVANLRWDTHKNNQADKYKHGTMANGEKQGLSKLTEMQVRSIRYQYDNENVSARKLATKYGVDQCTIFRILGRKTWKHI